MQKNKNVKIYVAGHCGVAGRAICELLVQKGYTNIVARTHEELDLTNQNAVLEFFEQEKPEWVILCAAKSGGRVIRNRYPAECIYENLFLETNVIGAAHKYGTKKLLFMSTSYVYPEMETPATEDTVFSCEHGQSDEAYIVAKLAGTKLCEYFWRQYNDAFFSVLPCAFFGEGDSFDLTKATVVPSMMRRMVEAKEQGEKIFEIWGTGTPIREFLSSKDIASGCLTLLEKYEGGGHFNLGNENERLSIADVAQSIKRVVDYNGELFFNANKPDGIRCKILDSSKLMQLGWKPKYSFEESVEQLYSYYKSVRTQEKNKMINIDKVRTFPTDN